MTVREFSTGSVRDSREGKGRMDLVLFGFPRALMALSKHCEEGARKYGDRNWERGQTMSAYVDSGTRHLVRDARGDADEDHLVAAAWNFLAMLETRERIRDGVLPAELDDRGLKAKPKTERTLVANVVVQDGKSIPVVGTIDAVHINWVNEGATVGKWAKPTN